MLTNQLQGAEYFLGSRKLHSCSKNSQYFMEPKFRYRFHKSPALVPILSPIKQIHLILFL
jgi:hypothetical protein